MSAITTTSNQSITQHFNTEQLKVLKQQIAPKCSDTELDYFIEVCKQTNLSPFTREIYAISRETWNPETQRKEPKMSIQVSIDGLRKRAANSGYYDGSTTFWCGEDGKWLEVWLKSTPPSAAKTVVYRKGCSQPFTAVARFDAYKQDFKGKLSGLWEKMPDIMIGKCSEALALRKAFPEQTAGLYASEEMDQASYATPQAQPVSIAQPEIATGWSEKIWNNFIAFSEKVDSVEKLEKLIIWVDNAPSKPNADQAIKIQKTVAAFAEHFNNASIPSPESIAKPVKSAQVEESAFTQEDIEENEKEGQDIPF
jgi:phage recombination protein Bet